ncbi:hypothetical protein CP533_4989 [Ophiocordyceps camponoti-saundersi (nom. inval.)]|nr:hypothetical protein CP533_4989 [Ophiocordyceps camponoti-saundersi (nom. inval.)]
MRERVTLILGPEAASQIDPSALKVRPSGQEVAVGPLRSAVVRQHRLTLTLDELPADLGGILRGVEAVRLRWASEAVYDSLEPFCSRTSPGLWVSLTALTGDWRPLLAFTHANIGGRPSLVFYQLIDNLLPFTSWAERQFCRESDTVCHKLLQSFDAVSLDISFDSSDDNLLRVAAHGALKEQEEELTVSASGNRRTEIGIFTKDEPPNIGPFEMGLGGFLTVVGEHKEPSPTLFAFPSRHRLSGASFSSAFLSPTGLHPTLQLNLSTDTLPAEKALAATGDVECKPYAHLTLPKAVFADRYQLQDELLLASKNLTALRHSSRPVDLEAPEYATKTWGSTVLLELAPPAPRTGKPWSAQVPLHVRYLRPTATGYADVQVPYPAVFWACSSPSQDALPNFANNPFDRLHVGYDSLFDLDRTTFWHVSPVVAAGVGDVDRLVNSLTVPTLGKGAEAVVRLGTTAVVCLGFAWVLRGVVGSLSGKRRGG